MRSASVLSRGLLGAILVAACLAPLACASRSQTEAATPSSAADAPGAPYAGGTSAAQPAPPQAGYPQAGSGAKATLEESRSDFDKAEHELADALDPAKAVPLATDRCTLVCKALASMRTAASHLCELTADDRCDDAKARLAKAESRAKEACPVCSAT